MTTCPTCGQPVKAQLSFVDEPELESNKELANQVIDYLNEKTGSSYRHVDSTRQHIVARLNDGETYMTLCAVIDSKCSDWLDNPDMAKHLNPTTLFRPKNFTKYVGLITKVAPKKESERITHPSQAAFAPEPETPRADEATAINQLSAMRGKLTK